MAFGLAWTLAAGAAIVAWSPAAPEPLVLSGRVIVADFHVPADREVHVSDDLQLLAMGEVRIEGPLQVIRSAGALDGPDVVIVADVIRFGPISLASGGDSQASGVPGGRGSSLLLSARQVEPLPSARMVQLAAGDGGRGGPGAAGGHGGSILIDADVTGSLLGTPDHSAISVIVDGGFGGGGGNGSTRRGEATLRGGGRGGDGGHAAIFAPRDAQGRPLLRTRGEDGVPLWLSTTEPPSVGALIGELVAGAIGAPGVRQAVRSPGWSQGPSWGAQAGVMAASAECEHGHHGVHGWGARGGSGGSGGSGAFGIAIAGPGGDGGHGGSAIGGTGGRGGDAGDCCDEPELLISQQCGPEGNAAALIRPTITGRAGGGGGGGGDAIGGHGSHGGHGGRSLLGVAFPGGAGGNGGNSRSGDGGWGGNPGRGLDGGGEPGRGGRPGSAMVSAAGWGGNGSKPPVNGATGFAHEGDMGRTAPPAPRCPN